MMALTAPGTAASTSERDHQLPVMTMAYTAGDLTAVVHAPRALVGTRPLVFQFRGFDDVAQSLARQGFVVVLVDDRTTLSRHAALWHALNERTGPLVERFRGFAGHFSVAEP
jgi:predicted dienelactone hydrolase